MANAMFVVMASSIPAAGPGRNEAVLPPHRGVNPRSRRRQAGWIVPFASTWNPDSSSRSFTCACVVSKSAGEANRTGAVTSEISRSSGRLSCC
jgi:hypothetical protein